MAENLILENRCMHIYSFAFTQKSTKVNGTLSRSGRGKGTTPCTGWLGFLVAKKPSKQLHICVFNYRNFSFKKKGLDKLLTVVHSTTIIEVLKSLFSFIKHWKNDFFFRGYHQMRDVHTVTTATGFSILLLISPCPCNLIWLFKHSSNERISTSSVSEQLTSQGRETAIKRWRWVCSSSIHLVVKSDNCSAVVAVCLEHFLGLHRWNLNRPWNSFLVSKSISIVSSLQWITGQPKSSLFAISLHIT